MMNVTMHGQTASRRARHIVSCSGGHSSCVGATKQPRGRRCGDAAFASTSPFMSRLPPEMLVNGRDDELFNKVKLSFDLPVDEAAARLGVCTTVLKKICRRKGINRWPFRKVSQPRFCRCLLPSMIAYWLQLSSLTGKIVACRARVNVSHGPTRERLESKIKRLDEEKRKILSGLHLGEHDLNFTSKGKAGLSACSPTANENRLDDLV